MGKVVGEGGECACEVGRGGFGRRHVERRGSATRRAGDERLMRERRRSVSGGGAPRRRGCLLRESNVARGVARAEAREDSKAAPSMRGFPCGFGGASVTPVSMDMPVEVKVGGFSYRVTGSASDAEMHRLAAIVDQRLRRLGGHGRHSSPHALLLVAMTLVHELEEERKLREQVEARSKEMLQSLLQRIEAALEADDAAAAAEQEQHPPAP